MIVIVAGVLIGGFALIHTIPTLMHLSTQDLTLESRNLPLLIAGLLLLGLLNCVAGLGVIFVGFRLGIIAVGLGMASINFGVVLNGYRQQADGPDWNLQAFRGGLSFFLVGLLVIYA